MASSEGSFLGLAKQTAEGTPNTTDAQFDYMLFLESALAANNIFRPLDREVGGGALPRGMVKVGVNSGGPLAFIPRPVTVGHLLHGVLGDVSTAGVGPSYTHSFALPTDEFGAPFYTLRNAPGNLWGEQFQDCRVTGLSLDWRGADYLRGTVSFLGGLPAKVSTAAWSVPTYLDGGAQFLAPLSTIELPTGTDAKVLQGSFIAAADIPLDEQYIVGKYVPDGLDIQNRSVMLSMLVKVTDDVLFTKMAYDPAAGSAWAAEVFKEANLNFVFNSDQEADTAVPYSLTVTANGNSGDTANVVWSCRPIGLRAGRQVTMQVNGLFLADATLPVQVDLVNTEATY